MKPSSNSKQNLSIGPNHPYSDTMNECTAALKNVTSLGIYMMGGRGQISYPLCKQCIKAAQRGLPPATLRVLDMRLEQRATELGLTQTQ
jgi:hypothetical protein